MGQTKKLDIISSKKNIPQQLIDKNMSVINENDYQNTIRELIQKKAGNKKKVSLKDKQKIIRNLQTKGYEFGTIMEVWKIMKLDG